MPPPFLPFFNPSKIERASYAISVVPSKYGHTLQLGQKHKPIKTYHFNTCIFCASSTTFVVLVTKEGILLPRTAKIGAGVGAKADPVWSHVMPSPIWENMDQTSGKKET